MISPGREQGGAVGLWGESVARRMTCEHDMLKDNNDWLGYRYLSIIYNVLKCSEKLSDLTAIKPMSAIHRAIPSNRPQQT
eukprot:scaffold90413_cov17-Tisochrysis_lutea.AAC.3